MDSINLYTIVFLIIHTSPHCNGFLANNYIKVVSVKCVPRINYHKRPGCVTYCDAGTSFSIIHPKEMIQLTWRNNDSNREMNGFSTNGGNVHYFPQFDHETSLKLIVVNILNSFLKSIDHDDLKNMKNLIVLNLAGNGIRFLEANLFQFNKKIKTLVLARNNVSIIDPEAFNGIEDFQHFDLRNNTCFDEKANSKEEIKKMLSKVYKTCKKPVGNSFNNNQDSDLSDLAKVNRIASDAEYHINKTNYFTNGSVSNNVEPNPSIYLTNGIDISELEQKVKNLEISSVILSVFILISILVSLTALFISLNHRKMSNLLNENKMAKSYDTIDLNDNTYQLIEINHGIPNGVTNSYQEVGYGRVKDSTDHLNELADDGLYQELEENNANNSGQSETPINETEIIEDFYSEISVPKNIAQNGMAVDLYAIVSK